jgi:hypothetical protein
MVVSNERIQGAKHQHLRAFPWVQLLFDRHFGRSVKRLTSAGQRCPAVLEPFSNS